jgi:hypothetical protein
VARSWAVLVIAVLLSLLAVPFGTAAAHATDRSRIVVILLDTNISPATT